MRRSTLAPVILLLALGGLLVAPASADQAGLPGASGTLWVTERTAGSSTITAFDAATGAVLGTTAVGSRPIGIVAPRGSGKVYTSDEAAGQVTVIDRDTIQLTKTIPLDPCPAGAAPAPHHLTAAQDGRFVYVAKFGCNRIAVLDTRLDEVVGDYATSLPGVENVLAHAAWVSRDGSDLYVANTRVDRNQIGDIAKLDAETGAVTWSFPVGKDPSEILVTPDGNTAYVSLRREHVVKVYDVSGALPVAIGTAEAKDQPDTLSLTPDGHTLVVGLRAPTSGPARMALIDTKTLETRYVMLGGSEGNHTITGHQWLSANGRYTFIAVETPGGIAVVDNRLAARVDYYPYPLGRPLPHGVFYEPAVLE